MDLLDKIMGPEKKGSEASKKSDAKKPGSSLQPPPLPSSSGGFVIPKKQRPAESTDERSAHSSSSYNKRPVDERSPGPIAKRSAYERPTSSVFAKQDDCGTFKVEDYIPVQINMFKVDLSRCPEIVERFHIDVTIDTPRKSVVVNGENIVRGDTNGTYRRNGLWNIWKSVVQVRADLFSIVNPAVSDGHSFAAYDCGSALYLPHKQYKGGDVEEVHFEKKDIESTSFWKPICKMLRAQVVKVTFRIMRNTGGKSDGLIYTKGERSMRRENRSELVRFLEVLSSQETNTRLFYTFGNATFTRDSDGTYRNGVLEPDLRMRIDSEGKEIRTGFEKSMRIVSSNEDGANVVMVLDVRRSAFYQKMSVLKFLTLIYQTAPGGGGGGGGYGRDQSRGGYGRNQGRGGYRGGYDGGRDQSRGSYGGRDQSRSSYGGDRDRDQSRGGGGYGRDQSRGGNYGDRDRDQSRGGYGRDRDQGRGSYDYQQRDERGRGRDGRDNGGSREEEEVDPSAVRKVNDIMRRDGEQRTNAKLDELRAVTVDVTHYESDKQTQFYIHSFDFRGANDTTFIHKSKDGEEKEVSVAQYFLEAYKLRLKYPELPLAVCKRSKVYSYIPLEVLMIEGGQRVKQHHISPAVQQEMTGKLSLLPAQHVGRYGRVLIEQLNISESVYLKSFNLEIGQEPFQMVAKILRPPTIVFGGNLTVTPTNGVGKRPNIMTSRATKFAVPAKIKSMRMIIFDRNIDERDVEQLCECIERAMLDGGCKVEESARRWKIQRMDAIMHEDIRDMLVKAKNDNVTLVVGITSDKRADVHDTLKLLESQVGQQTAHLSLQTVKQIGRNGAATLNNVIRKWNLKCGGLNFKTSTPGCRFQDKFFKSTMLVGFELSHAGATCLFDQQNNISCGEPTVVGVSHSLDTSTSLGGFSWLQKPREHALQYLSKHFPKIFLTYYDQCKSLPERVVIYRSGMGEGDYPRIEEEVLEMRECLETDTKLRDIYKKPYKPKMVVIIVQKNSHYRVFPQTIQERGKSFDQNCPSGTCIDSKVTGCGYDEFILVSQSALIGTLRPTRYTVLVNDEAWSKSEIAHLTYFSAFGHQVSYQPPGVPDVMYGAENNAKRGKNNLKAYLKIQKIERGGRGDRELVEDDVEGSKMDEMTEKLGQCSLKTHNFWA